MDLIVINQGDFFEFLLNDAAHWGICIDGDVCVYAGLEEVPDNAFIIRRLYRKWFPSYVVKVTRMQHLVLTGQVQRNSRGTEVALKAVKHIGSKKWKCSKEFVDSCQVKTWQNLLSYLLLFLLFWTNSKTNKSTPDENGKSDGLFFLDIFLGVIVFCVLVFIYYIFMKKRTDFLKVKEDPFAGVPQNFTDKNLMADLNRFNSSHKGEAEIILTPEFFIMTGDVEYILTCENFVQNLTTKIYADVHTVHIKMFGIQEFLQREEGKALIKKLENEHNCMINILWDSKPKTKLEVKNIKDQRNAPCGWDFGNINVTVIQGEIERQKTDVIVSTVDKSLILNFGTMASSVLRAAGDIIQIELLTRYRTGIKVGDFAQSTGGKLPCHYILHVCLPYYRPDNIRQILNTVSRLLDRVESLKSKSISFPALGTGILKYPPDISSEIIMEAIRRHAEKKKYNLQFVNIVVYSKDKKCFDAVLAKGSTLFNDNKRNLQDDNSKDTNTLKGITPAKSISEEVTVQIYSKDLHGRKEIFRKLQERFALAFKNIKKEESNLHLLSESQIENLKSLGLEHKIKVDVNCLDSLVQMKGFDFQGFSQVYDKLKELTKAAEEKSFQKHDQSDYFKKHENSDSFNIPLNGMLEKDSDETPLPVPQSVEWMYGQGKNWNKYDSLLNSEIEKEYHNKASHFTRQDASGNKYFIDFTRMIEICLDDNGDNKSSLKIKRQIKTKDLTKSQSWPKYWDLMSEKKNSEVIELNPESLEYKEVEKHFKLSLLGSSVMINKIQRIQNKSLFLQFCAKKDELELHNPENHQNERKLFHGTSASSINQINENGFNRSFCGKNGTAYGKGVYFATESSYSINYAPPDLRGNRYMYRARVLTGQFIATSPETKCPPKKPGTNRPYDSGGNKNQGIFVIFHDAQVYPEYLITYHL